MKDMFRSFKKPTEEELKELWENAVFVFDTNVLHSVYRYQSETCEEVLRLMEQLQDRIWIPYHVALEFHRNRLSVIASQHKKFAETRKAIKKAVETLGNDLGTLQLKKRHSHIDPDPLLEGISKLTDEYLVKLKSQEASCLKVESEDQLLGRIESILNGRVGSKPEDSAIKNIMSLGKERYKRHTPPGYKDAGKEKESDNKFIYDGINYERQFGDLIVWQQIIQYAKEEGKKHLIFVTDDGKEDWWQITQGKTIGFRNELIDEIYSETVLNLFHAYNLTSFLANASKILNETVSDAAIEEVKESQEALVKVQNRTRSVSFLNDCKNRTAGMDTFRSTSATQASMFANDVGVRPAEADMLSMTAAQAAMFANDVGVRPAEADMLSMTAAQAAMLVNDTKGMEPLHNMRVHQGDVLVRDPRYKAAESRLLGSDGLFSATEDSSLFERAYQNSAFDWNQNDGDE